MSDGSATTAATGIAPEGETTRKRRKNRKKRAKRQLSASEPMQWNEFYDVGKRMRVMIPDKNRVRIKVIDGSKYRDGKPRYQAVAVVDPINFEHVEVYKFVSGVAVETHWTMQENEFYDVETQSNVEVRVSDIRVETLNGAHYRNGQDRYKVMAAHPTRVGETLVKYVSSEMAQSLG